MSTPNCNDFCTADECFRLEQLIGDLQNQIIHLTNELYLHTQKSIPEAHDFTIEVKVNNVIENGELITDVTVNGVNDLSEVPLPDSVVPTVDVEVLPQGTDEYLIKVTVNDVSDEDYLILPNLDVAVGVFDIDESSVAITVQVGEKSDQDILTFPDSNETESNLVINGSFFDNTLNLTVADGESQSSVNIPINIDNLTASEHIVSNLSINGSFRNDTLNLTVADGESFDSVNIFVPTNDSPQTIFITEEIYMNCDELELKIDNCCAEILNSISSLQNIVVSEVEDSENNINNKIDGFKNDINNDLSNITNITTETKDYVTIDISGSVNGDYFCSFETDDKGNLIPGYAQSSLGQQNYSQLGIAGIHEILKILSRNLDSIHSDICRAIEPTSSITIDDLYEFCDHSGIERSDFSETPLGDEQYTAAVQGYFRTLLSNTKYGYLVERIIEANEDPLTDPTGSILITAPNNWITNMLADFSLIQSKINKEEICNIEIPEAGDVVSIVASPKYVTNVDGKVLILHFVTLDNYPKRQANSNYRQIQIPGAKESYDWVEDFKDLRWVQGNQYAEMSLTGYKATVSGWFRDAAAANSYFNQVLTLTTAEEKNRNIPNHSNPQTNIPVRETRPYRAFIESVNDAGQAVCEVKYVPVVED